MRKYNYLYNSIDNSCHFCDKKTCDNCGNLIRYCYCKYPFIYGLANSDNNPIQCSCVNPISSHLFNKNLRDSEYSEEFYKSLFQNKKKPKKFKLVRKGKKSKKHPKNPCRTNSNCNIFSVLKIDSQGPERIIVPSIPKKKNQNKKIKQKWIRPGYDLIPDGENLIAICRGKPTRRILIPRIKNRKIIPKPILKIIAFFLGRISSFLECKKSFLDVFLLDDVCHCNRCDPPKKKTCQGKVSKWLSEQNKQVENLPSTERTIFKELFDKMQSNKKAFDYYYFVDPYGWNY